jgi:hypothetical protein
MMKKNDVVRLAPDGAMANAVAANAAYRVGSELADKVIVLSAAERVLRDGGIGVDVDVAGLSSLSTSVDFYLDLAVMQDDVRRHRISPGRKNLLPDQELQSVQTQLRNNLYAYSFPLGILGTFRWVPDTAFMQWKEKHDELVEKFYRIRNEKIAMYDWLRADLVNDYRAMATETWVSLSSRGAAEEKAFTEQYTLESFQEAVVQKALEHLPTAIEMESNIRVVVRVATWLLPVEAAQDELERERLRTAARKEREEHDDWAREERAMTEAQIARSNARKAQAELDEQQARDAMRLAEVAYTEKARAIKNAQLELARESIKDMVNPLDEVIDGLRDRLYQSARDVLANINRHGRVLGKQVEAMQNMITMFRSLNAMNDDDLAQKIDALEEALAQPGTTTKRDAGAVTEALNQIAVVALQDAKSIAAVQYTEWDALEV